MCDMCEYIYFDYSRRKISIDGVIKKFDSFVQKGLFQELDLVEKDQPYLISRYHCNKCGRNWIVVYPDHAFQGKFYPEEDSKK